MEKELEEAKQRLVSKEKEIGIKDKRIEDLELMIRAQEKKYKDKITHLTQKMHQLKREAEESAKQNADILLTHRQNLVRASFEINEVAKEGTATAPQQEASRLSSASSTSSQGSSPRSKSSPKIKPSLQPRAPSKPKDGRPGSSGGRRIRMGSFELPPGHPVLRDGSAPLRVTRVLKGTTIEDESVPDPKPFLKLQQERVMAKEESVVRKAPSKPLPPMSKSPSETSPRNPAHLPEAAAVSTRGGKSPAVPSPHKADSADFKKLKQRSKKKAASQLEMETLALEDITKADVENLRKAQEYSSQQYGSD